MKKIMAKYSEKVQEKVEETMHEMKEGKLKSGRSGKKVTNPKQAIAIGLSEARKEGAKVPKKNREIRRKRRDASRLYPMPVNTSIISISTIASSIEHGLGSSSLK